jgi:hypothetical protein
MAPVIAKIVYVEELIAYIQVKELELGFCAALADDLTITVRGVRITISFSSDIKLM